MRSLRGLWHEEAWELRQRWMVQYADAMASDYELARSAVVSINGCADERAWSFREAAWPHAPVAALSSLTGLNCDRSWELRERNLKRAPKVVMATLRTLSGAPAYQMRKAVAADCKEVLDSIMELDDSEAWELRTRYADLWASTALKSLGCVADSARGQAFIERQLARHANNISLLKHASAVALGVHRRGLATALQDA